MKKTLMITGALALLFLSACTDTAQTTQTDSSETSSSQTSDSAPTTNAADNPSVTYSEADKAAFDGALQLRDTTYCDKITDTEYAILCNIAVKDQSALRMALTEQDVTVCKSLSTIDKKEACEIQVEVSLQQDSNQIALKKENELYNQIILDGTYEKCVLLTDQWLNDLCKENETISTVFKTEDISLCKTLVTNEKQTACEQAFKDYQLNKTAKQD